MENQMKIFENKDFGKVRTLIVENVVYFVGKDVCEIFGDTNYRRSLKNVDAEDKDVSQVDTAGGKQKMIVINESGLYSLLFQMQPRKAKGVSQNEQAIQDRIEKLKQFKRWVTSEVLPSIRKTGGYLGDSENMSDDEIMARALLVAQKTIENKNKELRETKQQLDESNGILNQITESDKSLLVREVAKLASKDGIIIGEKKLWNKMRDWKMIFQNSTEPMQRFIDNGYLEVVERTKKTNDKELLFMTTKVTGKGQIYIIKKLIKERNLLKTNRGK